MTSPAEDAYAALFGDMRQLPDGEWSPVGSNSSKHIIVSEYAVTQPVTFSDGLKVLAEKASHGIYESLREAGKDIQHSVLIIGLDSGEGAAHSLEVIAGRFKVSVEDLLTIPFFLYLEEYTTLEGTTREQPLLDLNRLILNHPNFLGVISHIKDTCTQVFTRLGVRCYHLPTSSEDKDSSKITERIDSLHSNRPVNLVFWGSYQDYEDRNGIGRGIRIVDDLVGNLIHSNSNVRLLLKNAHPSNDLNCQEMFPEKVETVTEYLDKDKLQNLFYTGDIFLLPSEQVHSASLTDVFSYGMPVIGSTGWGMSEYCVNAFNSLTADVAERHQHPTAKKHINRAYVNNMTPRLTALCNDRVLLAKMSENTLAWYNSNHSRENHKANLHRLVDLAMSRHVK